MYDRSLVIDLLDEIDEAIGRIDRRFAPIRSAEDFILSNDGLDRLDGIAGAPPSAPALFFFSGLS